MNASPNRFPDCFYAPLLLALALSSYSVAQTTTPSSNAAWTRAFAAAWRDIPATPPIVHNQGRENALNGDPRFLPLLKSFFPQHQWFWFDRYKFTPVANLVNTFIGVPGNAILDDDRYVTADGCVPHDCNDRGMLWIDTGTQPATLIFVATGMVASVQGGEQTRLWLFASKHMDFQNLPPAFLSSLERWHIDNVANGYKEDILLATLVQPNGQQVDLTYPTLYYKKNQPGAKK